MNGKLKVFCEQQLKLVLDKCNQEAKEIAELCGIEASNEEFINSIMVTYFHNNYYLTQDMKLLVGEDDALCQDVEV